MLWRQGWELLTQIERQYKQREGKKRFFPSRMLCAPLLMGALLPPALPNAGTDHLAGQMHDLQKKKPAQTIIGDHGH